MTKNSVNNAINFTESTTEGQGDEDSDAVSKNLLRAMRQRKPMTTFSGLDNAGKTTIVKQLMKEDVNTVSPTLGFIIRTVHYEGQVRSIPTVAIGRS